MSNNQHESSQARSMPVSQIAWPKGHPMEGVSPDSASAGLDAYIPTRKLEPASLGVRALYLMSLLPLLFMVGMTAFSMLSSLATTSINAVAFASVLSMGLPSVLALLAIAGRALDVLRGRCRLEAPIAVGVWQWLRQAAVLLMLVGVAAALLTLLSGPIIRALTSSRTDSGVEFFVARFWLGGYAFWAPAGLLLFEFGRLLRFERAARGN